MMALNGTNKRRECGIGVHPVISPTHQMSADLLQVLQLTCQSGSVPSSGAVTGHAWNWNLLEGALENSQKVGKQEYCLKSCFCHFLTV